MEETPTTDEDAIVMDYGEYLKVFQMGLIDVYPLFSAEFAEKIEWGKEKKRGRR